MIYLYHVLSKQARKDFYRLFSQFYAKAFFLKQNPYFSNFLQRTKAYPVQRLELHYYYNDAVCGTSLLSSMLFFSGSTNSLPTLIKELCEMGLSIPESRRALKCGAFEARQQ